MLASVGLTWPVEKCRSAWQAGHSMMARSVRLPRARKAGAGSGGTRAAQCSVQALLTDPPLGWQVPPLGWQSSCPRPAPSRTRDPDRSWEPIDAQPQGHLLEAAWTPPQLQG